MKYEKKFCAFIDILGFKDKMKNFDEAVKFYNSFMKTYEVYSSAHSKILEEGLKIANKQELVANIQNDLAETIFSDSVILYSKDWKDLLFRINFVISSLMLHGFVCRGGIGYGKHYSKIEQGRVLIVSEGLVEAVYIEAKISNYPRVVLSDSALMEIINGSETIDDTNNMLIQSNDNYWFINPFFLLPDLHNVAEFVNSQIIQSQDKVYHDKYLWLGELVNYFCNKEYARCFPSEYLKRKTYDSENYKIDLLCESCKEIEKQYLFFYPKVYTYAMFKQKLNYQLTQAVYKNSFEANMRLVIRQNKEYDD